MIKRTTRRNSTAIAMHRMQKDGAANHHLQLAAAGVAAVAMLSLMCLMWVAAWKLVVW
jgi:hypothetical protein